MMTTTQSCRFPLWLLAALMFRLGHSTAQVPPPPVSPPPVVGLEYDANGNFTKHSKAGLATSNSYDRLDRRWKTTDPRAKATLFGYSGRDDLSHVIDPRSLVTQYPRNGLGDATALISPDTGSQTHTFDAAGNLLTRIDSRGVLATYSYDALNRLRSINYTGSGVNSQAFIWDYDQTGAAFSYGIGRLTSTQFPAGSATYAYDPQGRISSTTQVISRGTTAAFTVRYGYDSAGNVLSITYPSGRVVNIPHSGGVPTGMSLTPAGGGATIGLITNLQLQPGLGAPGRPTAWNWQFNSGPYPNTRVFDSYGRMVRYPLGGSIRDLSYDAADRIVSYTHWNALSGAAVAMLDQAFGYDELGRLTGIGTIAGNWSIAYDDNGNRTYAAYGPTDGYAIATNFSIDPGSNRMLYQDYPARSFGYDAAGNVVLDNGSTAAPAELRAGSNSSNSSIVATPDRAQISMTIDASGRLAAMQAVLSGQGAMQNGRNQMEYFYDTFGKRVLKQGTVRLACPNGPINPGCKAKAPLNVAVAYVYDQQGHLLGEYNLRDGSVVREYVWLQDMPVAIVDGSPSTPEVYYVQTDHLDTPRVVLDRAGRQRWSWISEPFGNNSPIENPIGIGSFTLNLRMPGQYFDNESYLSDNGYRSYDSSVGRYTQSDPIGLAGGINTYAYVGGNPVSFVDPTGLFTEVIIWNGVGRGSSAFGHVSTNINGSNYSFGPGGWDKTFPSNADYVARNLQFRGGTGYMLNLTPAQESALAQCLGNAKAPYSSTSNNCGTSVQSCLASVGVNVGNSMLPGNIGAALGNSPALSGTTTYAGPPRPPIYIPFYGP